MRLPAWIPSYLPVIGVLVTGVVGYVNLHRDVGDNAVAVAKLETAQAVQWSDHMDYHREKASENAGIFARIETRVAAIEAVVPKTDQLTYRVGAVEEQSAATVRALQDLQQTVNSQAGDIRLILDILRRQDAKPEAGNAKAGRL